MRIGNAIVYRKPASLTNLDRQILLEDLVGRLRGRGHAAPDHEYRMQSDRRWRFDLAWPAQKVAVEIQGGGYVHGHHVRGHGYEQDCWKQLAAAAAGWQVLQLTWGMLAGEDRSGQAKIDRVVSVLDWILAHHGEE